MTTLCEYAAKNYKTCVRVSKWMVPRVSGTPWCPAYTGNHHFWPKTYYKALALLKFDFLTLVWPQAWRTLLNHGNNWKLCLPNNCYSVFRAKIAMSQSVCLIYGNTHWWGGGGGGLEQLELWTSAAADSALRRACATQGGVWGRMCPHLLKKFLKLMHKWLD